MINLNGSVLRNLEEQVQYLTEQLNALKTLNGGFNIVAIVNSVEDIPEEYTGNIGDCYLVHNDTNDNDLYMYNGESFTYLGMYPLRGPQGGVGQRGATGATGDSTKWYTGLEFPGSAKLGDMFLKTDTCQVYRYESNTWVSKCNIKGLAGTDGLNGNSIISITPTYSSTGVRITITTSNGGTANFNVQNGEPGTGFHIAHIYPQDDADIQDTLADYLTGTTYDSMEALLNSIYPAANANPADALLVKTNDEGDYMFVIIRNSSDVQVWDNVGQIESVQGPAGEPGTQITSNEQIQVHAIDDTNNDLNILSLPYLTTAPSSAYTPIGTSLKLVVLSSEPATYYSGYYYIITEE